MLEIGLLTPEIIEKSKLFKGKNRANTFCTDFALINGIICENHYENAPYLINDNGVARIYYNNKIQDIDPSKEIQYGIRPVIKYSTIKEFCHELSPFYLDKDNFKRVIFGNFPGKVTYLVGGIKKYGETTGKKYAYEYGTTVTKYHDEYRQISSGEHYALVEDKRYYKKPEIEREEIFKIEKITWLVDEELDIAVCQDVIMAGIPFGSKNNSFKQSTIYDYLNNHFKNEIISKKRQIAIERFDEFEVRLLTPEEFKQGAFQNAIKGVKVNGTDFSEFTGFKKQAWALAGEYTEDNTYCWAVNCKTNELSNGYIVDNDQLGIRPVIQFRGNQDYFSSRSLGAENGFLKVIMGEYPQRILPDSYMDKNLNTALANGDLKKTGRTFYINRTDVGIFSPFESDEYVDNDGGKFVIVGKRYLTNPTDGTKIPNHRWMKVEPLVWFYDRQHELLMTKDVIIGGIRNGESKKINNFEESEIYKYLNKYFKFDAFNTLEFNIISNDNVNNYTVDTNKTKAKKKDNVYDFTLERVDEEDIIRGCIKGDIPVFLHGESSEGKSARVKQIDSDCVILYLSNATPESLNGKSVYDPNKGEIVDMPPSWYVKLKKKCEEEPDNIHVLFFDELTNALPSIQGMAFNIILDREVNGVWKLPSNCRIAASGNDMDESLAANELAKPLFNRLAHVYIKTTVPNWLKWASKNNIHPAIYAFVAYNGEKVLRTKYNGEKPHADPRRWEMASNMLYATNKPYLLRGILGEGITEQLVAFCKQTVITLDDVLNHNYTNEDLKMNVGQKYMTAVGLSLVDEEHVKEVREFVTNLGAEICATFDSMWCHGDEERIKKLAEIDMLSNKR